VESFVKVQGENFLTNKGQKRKLLWSRFRERGGEGGLSGEKKKHLGPPSLVFVCVSNHQRGVEALEKLGCRGFKTEYWNRKYSPVPFSPSRGDPRSWGLVPSKFKTLFLCNGKFTNQNPPLNLVWVIKQEMVRVKGYIQHLGGWTVKKNRKEGPMVTKDRGPGCCCNRLGGTL